MGGIAYDCGYSNNDNVGSIVYGHYSFSTTVISVADSGTGCVYFSDCNIYP